MSLNRGAWSGRWHGVLAISGPVVVAGFLATGFVLARRHEAADGDLTRFVVAGSTFTEARPRPSRLFVFPGDGYDGQFAYRIAVDPVAWDQDHDGIRIDAPLRFERIAYPVLAFLVSGGSERNVPRAMVLVNVVGIATIAGLGAALARASGRSSWWGLAFPVYFGFVASLSRDLTEIVEVAFLLAAMLALRRDRAVLASVALSLAVLSRETALFAVAGLAACAAVRWVRRRERPGAADFAWVAPVVVFGAWELLVRARAGTFGVESGVRASYPGRDLIRSIPHWFEGLDSGPWLLHAAEGVALLVVVVVALIAVGWSRAPTRERYAYVALVVGMVVAWHPDGSLWLAPHDYRMFADVWVMALLVILGLRTRAFAVAIAAPVAAAVLTPLSALWWIRNI